MNNTTKEKEMTNPTPAVTKTVNNIYRALEIVCVTNRDRPVDERRAWFTDRVEHACEKLTREELVATIVGVAGLAEPRFANQPPPADDDDDDWDDDDDYPVTPEEAAAFHEGAQTLITAMNEAGARTVGELYEMRDQ